MDGDGCGGGFFATAAAPAPFAAAAVDSDPSVGVGAATVSEWSLMGVSNSVDSREPCTPSTPHRAILSLQLMDVVGAPRPGFNRAAPRCSGTN